MQTLTYQGLPVIRPSAQSARIIPCCPYCDGAVVWVLNDEGKEDPRCIDSGCPSHAARENLRLRIMLLEQKEKEERQVRNGLRCLFLMLSPIFLSAMALGLVLRLLFELYDGLKCAAGLIDTLWNGEAEG